MNRSISKPGIAIVLAACLVSCGGGSKPVATVQFLADSIQKQHVPDSRIAVFDIKVTGSRDGILLSGKTSEPAVYDRLLTELSRKGIPCSDSVLILPDPGLGDQNLGLITLSVANMRYNPSHSAEMATQAVMGTPVRVLQADNGHYLVQTPDRYIAWTESAGIARMTENQMSNWKASRRFIFTSDYGLVYSQPDHRSTPVSDLVAGAILQMEPASGPVNSFLPVSIPDGRKGFVMQDKVAGFQEWISGLDRSTENLIATAIQFMGRPYLWGGTSGKAFDCSGFTKTVYYLNGWILDRDASQQVHQGDQVDLESAWHELVPGDLLFFGRKATADRQERASHVGMYTGNSLFIHCSGMVRINSLDSLHPLYRKYYTDNLLRARRMVGAASEPITINNHPWYY